MGYNAAPLERLIEEFAKLPGIGRKGATRLAYQVLSMEKEEALRFAHAIEEAQRMKCAPSARTNGETEAPSAW